MEQPNKKLHLEVKSWTRTCTEHPCHEEKGQQEKETTNEIDTIHGLFIPVSKKTQVVKW